MSDAHAHEDFGKPSVFAVTDLSVEEALPFFRVLHPLTRFGYRVAAVASSQIISCLKWKPQYKYCLEDNVVDKVRPTWKYVVAACSQDSLARLALGLQDTACAKIILQAIWHGIDVYVNLDCLKTLNGTASKNNTLKDLYATYAVNLGNMGIKSVPNGKYLAVLLDELVKINPCPTKKDSNKEIKPEELHVSEKRQKKMVVTQGDIYSFKGKNTTWDLPRDAIITSLAADAAKEAGITLRKTVP
ncbi:MAG: hypothetical protein LBJ36_07020 [Synergistaceae bacterium]|nr:hypothetical protein [Synergistaceae bacterium]